MTGKDLVTLYRKIRKVLQEEADNLIALFKMTEYINNTVGTYSTGMTKKLSLVLAFIGDPGLIILDEPLITLDADTFKVVSDLILNKNRTIGTCFLMSSHQDLDKEISIIGKELIVHNRTISIQ
jgi:ABC-2 type transport system ATP-binding protein